MCSWLKGKELQKLLRSQRQIVLIKKPGNLIYFANKPIQRNSDK